MLQIEPSNVRMGAQAASKESAIRQVAELLVASGCIEPGYADSMLARERVANTYLGKGVAIPHGLPKDHALIKRTGIAVLQVPAGVAWQPGQPGDNTARIIVGIAAKSDEHIEILSNLTDILYDDQLVGLLAVTRDPLDMITALSAARRETAVPASEEPDFDLAVDATVAGAHGLHARPATAFVETAKGFDADVLVRSGTKTADGKSLAALLKLGAKAESTLRISARGPQAAAALQALKAQAEAGEEAEIVLAGPAHGWVPREAGATVPGLAASPGLAIGPVRLLRRSRMVVERTAQDPERERERLRDAIAVARAELQELYQDVARKSGKAGASIFLAHAELLADAGLLRRADARIAEGQSAGWAWQQTFEAEAEALRKVDDALIAGRATDLCDVGMRVLRGLADSIEETIEPNRPHVPVILLAED
jgi:phosphotransferase system HPr (HPr) family protein